MQILLHHIILQLVLHIAMLVTYFILLNDICKFHLQINYHIINYQDKNTFIKNAQFVLINLI